MARNIAINIDEDVNKVVRKISRYPDTDITLVLPKGSLLFFDIVNLKLLKKHADDLGKTIAILTMDPKGQNKAAEVGFALKSFEDLRRMGPAMDGMPRRSVPQSPRPVQKAAPAPAPVQATPAQTSVPNWNAPMPNAVTPVAPAQPVIQPKTDRPIMLNPVAEQRFMGAQAPRKSRALRNFMVFSLILGVVLLGLLVAVVLPKAQLTIFAHSQALSKDIQVNLDANAKSIDVDKLVLPVKPVKKESVLNQRFDATGQINLGNKATGKVQIYNFTGRTLRLNVGTTVLKAGNKRYVLKADLQNLKPTKYIANTKDVDPASLVAPVEIVATEAGETSNLPAGTQLEIDNQVLGPQPNILYGLSFVIGGGTTRLSQVVTQQDLDNAAKQLRDKALATASAELEKTQGIILPDTGNVTTVKNLAFDKVAGDQTVSFTGSIDLNIEGAGYARTDYLKLIRERLGLTLGANKVLSLDKEKITSNLKSFDPASGKGFLSVHYEGAIISKIDPEQIKAQVPGKTAQELKEFLLSNPDIDGVEVGFSPFWVKSVPKYSGKIDIEIKAQ